jgi:hypothetical protein
MKTDAYKFKKNCKIVDELCHNTLNRIVTHMEKYHDHCKELGDYVKLCVVIEKLCNYCCTICCNDTGLTDHSLKECKLKCNSMIKCCKTLNKTKISKTDLKHIRCEEMIKACNNLVKMCN